MDPSSCLVCHFSGPGLHRFPIDKKRLRDWLIAIERTDLLENEQRCSVVYNFGRVCNAHFADSCFCANDKKKLKKSAVPSLFQGAVHSTSSNSTEGRSATQSHNIDIRKSSSSIPLETSIKTEIPMVKKEHEDKIPSSRTAICEKRQPTDMAISCPRKKILKSDASCDSPVNINCLPQEILEKIFSYMDFKERCRIGRVSKIWYRITRYPVFWRRIFAKVFQPDSALKLINILQSHVTYINLNFEDVPKDSYVNVKEFSMGLQEKCTHLESLIINKIKFCVNIAAKKLGFWIQMHENLKMLILRNTGCKLKFLEIDENELLNDGNIFSKIEVLDFTGSSIHFWDPATFLRLTSLKVLRLCRVFLHPFFFDPVLPYIMQQLQILDLESTIAGSDTFDTIRIYGVHLTELYMCETLIEDEALVFVDTCLPRLKKICLRGNDVTSVGIMSLIKWCPSLDHVYVGREEVDPRNDYSDCNSEKVHVINGYRFCNHFKEVEYILKTMFS